MGTDAEIGQMDIETLLHVESDLRQQNSAADKHVASLHGRLDKLRIQQQKLERKFQKVNSARDWETKQKEARTKLLERARADMESKRMQAGLLGRQAEKLRDNLAELDRKVKYLHSEEEVLKGKFSRPSFEQVLMNEAERVSVVTQQLANKTVQNIFPDLQFGMQEADFVRQQIHSLSGPSSVLVVMFLYVIGISILVFALRCLQALHHSITLPRLLLSTDVVFVIWWFFVLMAATIIEDGPLRLITSTHIGFSMFILIVLMAAMIGNVFLRCVLVCYELSAWSFGELFCTIFVAQHFYQIIWTPFLMDQSTSPTLGTYFFYVLIHASLTVRRARSIKKMPSIDKKSFAAHPNKGRDCDWLKNKMAKAYQRVEDFFTYGWNCDESEGGSFVDDDISDDDFSFRRKWERRTGNVMSWKERTY